MPARYVKVYPHTPKERCFAYNQITSLRAFGKQSPNIMIQTWHITPTQNIKLDMDSSSLDAITRQLPDGYYSTFRTFAACTRVLGLTAHLQRLYDPVSTPAVGVSSLRRRLFALLEPYRADEARVRTIMTRPGQVYVAIEPLKLLPREVYEKGVRVETTELERESPRLKSTAFISASNSERQHLAHEGFFEALLVKEGEILEGMTSNFFYVHHPRAERNEVETTLAPARSAGERAQHEITLCTAQHDILLGITRQTVIELAQQSGLDVQYQPLKLDQLADVEEAFITSSSRGIVPVIQIDTVTIGQGDPASITKQLSAAYNAHVIEKAEYILP